MKSKTIKKIELVFCNLLLPPNLTCSCSLLNMSFQHVMLKNIDVNRLKTELQDLKYISIF